MKLRLIMFLALIACCANAFSKDPTITICYYERMPFFGQIETGDEGILLTITSEILRTAGISYRFAKMPVARIFETVGEDTYACLPGVFRTPDREAVYRFSSLPIYQDTPPHYVIRRADQSDYANVHTIKDLLTSEKTLGLAERYSYGQWVDKNVKDVSTKKRDGEFRRRPTIVLPHALRRKVRLLFLERGGSELPDKLIDRERKGLFDEGTYGRSRGEHSMDHL